MTLACMDAGSNPAKNANGLMRLRAVTSVTWPDHTHNKPRLRSGDKILSGNKILSTEEQICGIFPRIKKRIEIRENALRKTFKESFQLLESCM